jgi:aspartate/methionine/tyrosine aminotransferase
LSDALARIVLRSDVRPRILERTRAIVNANLPVLQAWMEPYGTAFHLVPPRAGAIAFVRYGWDANSTELVERLLLEQSVLVVPGDQFGMDGYLRIALGSEPGHLAGGLRRVDAILETLPAPLPAS